MKYHHIPLFSVLLSIAISGCLADKEEFELYMSSGTDITDPTSKCNGEFCPGASCKYPGDRACSEDKKQLLVCGTNKQYRVDQTCAYQCDAGQCVNYDPEPDPEPDTKCTNHNDTKCTGDNVYICQNGEWQIHELCQNGCENGTCLSEQLNCPAGQHVYNDACEYDSIDNCGQHNYHCKFSVLGWKTGICQNGTCLAHTCIENMHPEDGICVDDNAECSGEFCPGTSCKYPGDHACSEDKKQLLVCDINKQYRVDKTCPYQCDAGQCVNHGPEPQPGDLNCPDGQHVYNDACEYDSIDNCGQHNYHCKFSVSGWKTGICQNGTCLAQTCIENMHTDNGICVTDDAEHCGATQINCTQTITGWKTGICQNGTCLAKTCIDNMHIEGNSCVADNAEHCGAAQINCTKTVTGWGTGNCVDGTCQIETCADNYHLSAAKCIPDTSTCCGSSCTNCGQGLCSLGKCTTTCDASQTPCGSECVNTNNNTNHCGVCNNDCTKNKPAHAKTMFCDYGQCVISSCEDGYLFKNGQCVACETVDGWAKCSGICIETTNDGNNCGGCGKTCDYGMTCSDGKCLGNKFCDGITYNTATSIDNCGDCDNRCPDGKTCIDGNCVTGNGPSYCGNVTTNVMTDISNCGFCGHHCENSVCTNGSCVPGQGPMYCSNILINSQTDSANCNGCSNICAQGYKCSNGACNAYSLNSSSTITCNGKTVYPYNDSDNCGKCGNTCESRQYCAAGVCTNITSTTTIYCDDHIVYPYSDSSHCGECGNDCGTGKYCAAGVCTNITSTTTIYCDDHTVRPYSDSSHCGKCNNTCPKKYKCSSGTCQYYVLSPSSTLICNGSTVYPYSDSSNCGGCGYFCEFGQYCDSGTCFEMPIICTAGAMQCDGANLMVCNATGTGYDLLKTCSADVPHATATCEVNDCKVECNAGYYEVGGVCVKQHSIGDIITGGHYEQDNDTTNGKEPIEWRIIDKNTEGQYLIISEKVLDVKPYNTTNISVTWEKSTIRSWLNGYAASYNTVGTSFTSDNFIDTTFTAAEKAKIVASNVPAHANPKSYTSPGNATTDKIFLLSVVEANQYFTSDEDRKVMATLYAVNGGVYSYNYDSKAECTVDNFQMNKCSAAWWTRSPGVGANKAAYVAATDGHIPVSGHYVDYGNYGVRPAMWLTID